MKVTAQLLILAILFASCSREFHTTKQAVKNYDQLEAVSRKIFGEFNKETYIAPLHLDTLSLTAPELRLLTRKLKCPYVQVNYTGKDAAFFSADSVVIFTRAGIPIIGVEHDIIVDMRQTTRDSIPVATHYIKYYRIKKGMYYIQESMPPF